MKYVNKSFRTVTVEDGGIIKTDVFLADDPADCGFWDAVDFVDSAGNHVSLSFPFMCSQLAVWMIKEGQRVSYIGSDWPKPYGEVAVEYTRLGRTFVIGRSLEGRHFVHCKLADGHGLITEIGSTGQL